jgi:hypothetical protein
LPFYPLSTVKRDSYENKPDNQIMRIGITGHRELAQPDWVKQQIRDILAAQTVPLADIIGVTSLAIGADQLFAQAVIEGGGQLHAILPMPDYARTFSTAELPEYERLLALASIVDVLPALSTDEDSFFEAGKQVVDRSEFTIAVWNGKPAAGPGGTGDVVEYALKQQKNCVHYRYNPQNFY